MQKSDKKKKKRRMRPVMLKNKAFQKNQDASERKCIYVVFIEDSYRILSLESGKIYIEQFFC